jgi:hypothetical protein
MSAKNLESQFAENDSQGCLLTFYTENCNGRAINWSKGISSI